MLALLLAAPITVMISGVESDAGRVHVDICTQAEFLKPDCRWSAEAKAVAGTTTLILPDVPPGLYAAQAYHDRNGNGHADRNLFGIPTERVGFSNDARVHLAPPKFAAAAFDHGDTAQTIAFPVRKLP